jgi:hypothetical protein
MSIPRHDEDSWKTNGHVLMKRVYIAHPFTTHGDAEENFSKQVEICQRVFSMGYIPVSPILTFGRCIPHDKDHYQIAMDACFWLLSACDEVWFFGEWQKSKGCKLEHELAQGFGMKIVYEHIQLLPDATGDTSNTKESTASV